MRALSAAELLAAWERGRSQGAMDRALTLLETACPGSLRDQLALLSVGTRDAALLRLRESAFGSEIESVATCPSCGQKLELLFKASEIRAPSLSGPSPELTLSSSGYELTLRVLDTASLIQASTQPDFDARRRLLFEACVVSARCNGESVHPGSLPEAVLGVVAERLAEADPQANVQLAVSCAGCGHHWAALFDIVSFFWSELEAWSLRTLREVHTLASAYGWREADILQLSAGRRLAYLQMVGT